MNDGRLSPPAPLEDGAVRPEELPGPAIGGPEHPAESPPRPEATVGRSGWTVGRVVALVVGVVLVLVSLGLLASGGTGSWADRTQRDAGYATREVHRFSTAGSAVATEPGHVGSAVRGGLGEHAP